MNMTSSLEGAEAKFLSIIEQRMKTVLTEIESIRAQTEKAQKDVEEAEARNDFSENAELDEAKQRRASLEVRMIKLVGEQNKLKESLRRKKTSGYVSTSSIVAVKTKEGQEYVVMIVDHNLAGFNLELISEKSPLAKAIEGKTVGDSVVVVTAKKTIEYTIEGVI